MSMDVQRDATIFAVFQKWLRNSLNFSSLLGGIYSGSCLLGFIGIKDEAHITVVKLYVITHAIHISNDGKNLGIRIINQDLLDNFLLVWINTVQQKLNPPVTRCCTGNLGAESLILIGIFLFVGHFKVVRLWHNFGNLSIVRDVFAALAIDVLVKHRSKRWQVSKAR